MLFLQERFSESFAWYLLPYREIKAICHSYPYQIFMSKNEVWKNLIAIKN